LSFAAGLGAESDALDDEELAGGVLGVLDVSGGGVLGAMFGRAGADGLIDDEEDVDGDDGDGVTTGGVLGAVPVVVSRLQPAAPSTTPVHRTVMSARFISNLQLRRNGVPPR
jgi:hypothetical protein